MEQSILKDIKDIKIALLIASFLIVGLAIAADFEMHKSYNEGHTDGWNQCWTQAEVYAQTRYEDGYNAWKCEQRYATTTTTTTTLREEVLQ
jgi:hypothetical protein